MQFLENDVFQLIQQLSTIIYFIIQTHELDENRIGGVMVCVIASSAANFGFKALSCQILVSRPGRVKSWFQGPVVSN